MHWPGRQISARGGCGRRRGVRRCGQRRGSLCDRLVPAACVNRGADRWWLRRGGCNGRSRLRRRLRQAACSVAEPSAGAAEPRRAKLSQPPSARERLPLMRALPGSAGVASKERAGRSPPSARRIQSRARRRRRASSVRSDGRSLRRRVVAGIRAWRAPRQLARCARVLRSPLAVTRLAAQRVQNQAQTSCSRRGSRPPRRTRLRLGPRRQPHRKSGADDVRIG